MKKNIGLLLLVLLITACVKSDPGQSVEATLTPARLTQVERILALEAGAIRENISEEAKKQVSPESFESQVYDLLKTYTIESYKLSEEGDLVKAQVEAKPSNFVLSIYFQGDKISGIFLRNDIQSQSGPNFKEEAVQVGPYKLKGLVRYPVSGTSFPLVILMGGSGPNDMDETIKGNRLLLDLAEGLAEQGIATLRFNDRFYEKAPEADQLTIESEMLEDVGHALTLAQGLDSIDKEHIYYLGHSLGGMMGPKLLQDHPDFKGAILMAGTPRGLEEVIYDQNLNQLNAQNATDMEKNLAKAQLQAMITQIQAIQAPSGTMIMNIPDTYWHSLNLAKAPQQRFEQPLLILQGENDFQVSAELDFLAWKTLYKEKSNVTYKLYPGLSHLFMPGPSKSLKDYETAQKLDAHVIKDIVTWLKSQP